MRFDMCSVVYLQLDVLAAVEYVVIKMLIRMNN